MSNTTISITSKDLQLAIRDAVEQGQQKERLLTAYLNIWELRRNDLEGTFSESEKESLKQVEILLMRKADRISTENIFEQLTGNEAT